MRVEGKLYAIDVLSGKDILQLGGSPHQIKSVAFLGEDELVIVYSKRVTMRNVTNSYRSIKLNLTQPVDLAVISQSGDKIITMPREDDRIVHIWNLQKRSMGELAPHTDSIYSAEFSPDGDKVVTLSRDGTAKVWNIKDRRCITTLTGGPFKFAKFSPQGDVIITASFLDNDPSQHNSQAATVQIWEIDGPDCIDFVFKAEHDACSAEFNQQGDQILVSFRDHSCIVNRKQLTFR